MTLEQLRDKVMEWDQTLEFTDSKAIADSTAKYATVLAQLDYNAEREWNKYLPTQHPEYTSNYMERLAAWIGNVPNEVEQKLLLEYALFISFFSHSDFTALYQTAIHRVVMPWMAEQIQARLGSSCDAGQRLSDSILYEINHHTWFCPVTDSMDINEFYKINCLSGIEHHPQFATLQEFGHQEKICRYMQENSLTRIVLLEDFVGTGIKSIKPAQWAVENLSVPILFIPLICCPLGLSALRQIRGLTVRPVVELQNRDLLGDGRKGDMSWPIATDMEAFARTISATCGWDGSEIFGVANTGCSIILFSNTPANTLSFVHKKSQSTSIWHPLFPRVSRGLK